ncbi:gamma-glutamyltransferase [Tabrizicola sp. J26]|uniref:gamma-glutamyltransferase n=1 Tax=Alitabrizicola rongguiensis TaxID=2909234 RepID=UPI001F1F8454|nr:gamma-glutamyltransferase [Tabrizicola rongguiensis]MCF1709399.1 gamma-glutamyltransferase [Tabrizicola rongguiensis]
MPTAADQWVTRKPFVTGSKGVVAAQHVQAARAGAELLERGGNAVDAAVAAALALGPVEPWMCGVGGSGFMVIWLAKEERAVALDYQGVLPADLTVADYPIDPTLPVTSMGFPAVRGFANTQGATAVTVPGAVAGFDHALQHYGRSTLADALEPAIRLAEDGIAASWFCTLMIASEMTILRNDPVASAVFLPNGAPLQPGERLQIPNLAETLRRLARDGAATLYGGDLGRQFVEEMRTRGSRITIRDLESYAVHDYEPMEARHRGMRLFTPGEQSGGMRQRDFLAEVAARMPAPRRQPDAESWLVYAEALEQAWRAHRLRNGTLSEVGSSTSSLSAVDAEGNMVALTYTLLDHFGAGIVLPESGLLLNNGASYFDPRPDLRTSMQGGKRINSSNMVPTIAVRDGIAQFAIGASGGDLIMPCVSQIAALMIDFGMSLEEAMHSPRLDASHRGSVRADPRLGAETLKHLSSRFALEVSGNVVMPKLYACPSGVARLPDGSAGGVNDPCLPDGGAVAV